MPLTAQALRTRQVLLELIQDPEYLDHYRCHGLFKLDDAHNVVQVCPIGALAGGLGWEPKPYRYNYTHLANSSVAYDLATHALNDGLNPYQDDATYIQAEDIYNCNDQDELEHLAELIVARTPEFQELPQ